MKFEFACTSFLGYSHCGSVTADGYGSIELTDTEVDTLVNLIRANGSSDIEGICLQENYPDLYEKLDEAYRDAAREATIAHWYMEGFREGVYEYDEDELIEYCSENHGFEFSYDEEDYTDEDGEVDEDALYDDRHEAFSEWLEDFVVGLDTDKMVEFLTEHMNADVDTTDLELDYQVKIPDEIIRLANEDK